MAEETDVKTEVVAQEESQVPQEQTHETESQEAKASVKKDEEVNWKKARETLEAQKRELDLMKERERHYQEQLQKIAAAQPKEEDELSKLSEDDILTKRQAEKLAEVKFKRLIEDFENQKGEDKARQECSDYDAVVTPENLERLQKEHPEVIETLKATPKLYHKAKSAYKFIKAVYGSQETTANRENLEKNLSKPRSVNSVGTSAALSQASAFEKGLTPELKKQMLAEMIQSSKRS